MPSTSHVRAAGGSLTAGELRDLLDGLNPNDPVLVDGDPIYRAEAWGGRVHISTGDVESGSHRLDLRSTKFVITGEVA